MSLAFNPNESSNGNIRLSPPPNPASNSIRTFPFLSKNTLIDDGTPSRKPKLSTRLSSTSGNMSNDCFVAKS